MDSFARLLTQGLNESIFFDEEPQDPLPADRPSHGQALWRQQDADLNLPASTSARSGSTQCMRARRHDASPQQQGQGAPGKRPAAAAEASDRWHTHAKHRVQALSRPAPRSSRAVNCPHESEWSEEEEPGQGGGLLDVVRVALVCACNPSTWVQVCLNRCPTMIPPAILSTTPSGATQPAVLYQNPALGLHFFASAN